MPLDVLVIVVINAKCAAVKWSIWTVATKMSMSWLISTAIDFAVGRITSLEMIKSKELPQSYVDYFMNLCSDAVEGIQAASKKVKSVVGNFWRKLTGKGPKSE